MPALPCPATCTNARRSLSDNDQSDRRMLARPATMWSLKTDSSRNLFLERTASLSKLSLRSCARTGAVRFDGDSFSGGKAQNNVERLKKLLDYKEMVEGIVIVRREIGSVSGVLM